MKIEDYKKTLSEDNFFYFGHGVDYDENVEEIFQKGLKCICNSLVLTVKFITDCGSLDKFQKGISNKNIFNCKEIIVIKIPMELINVEFSKGRDYYPFYIKRDDKYYIDPKFIIGCYNFESNEFKLNSSYIFY